MNLELQKVTEQLLDDCQVEIKKAITKAINCGALNTDDWDANNNPMIMPKIIAIAVLENQAHQMKGFGTKFEKEVKKEVKNLALFL